MSRAYLDHNATAPLRPEARRAIEAELNRPAANPSSAHAEGARARAAIDRARTQVAQLLGSRPHEIVLTASGTEACNLAVWGSARTPGRSARRIAALCVEHPAVLDPLRSLASDGWTIDLVDVGRSGRVNVDDMAASIHDDTALVACMWANNENGAVQPVAEIAALCAGRGVRLFVDATQAAGRLPISLGNSTIDLLAISSHKIGGPAGAGALFVREGTRLLPQVCGGGQERGLRAGTEDSVMLAGFGAAAEAARLNLDAEVQPIAALRNLLISRVAELAPQARLVAGDVERLPNTAQFVVPHDDEEILILALDRAGFAVSAGSACSAGAHRRSHVLSAMGVLPKGHSSVRVSLGASNTAGEIEGFARALAFCLAGVNSEAAG